MLIIVATNVIASQLPDRRPTGTLNARANNGLLISAAGINDETFSGHSVLYSKMVVEKLGGGENHSAHDGLGHRGGVRGGEEAEEEAPAGLPVRQPQEPQLVGLQILLL